MKLIIKLFLFLHCCYSFSEIEVYFSPDDQIAKKLINYIDHEQKSIQCALYLITDRDVVQALIRAKKRGVDIELVTDQNCCEDRFGKVAILREHGISLLVYAKGNQRYTDLMHNKFFIFEKNKSNKSLLWTGSFNPTKSANKANQENVIVIDDMSVVRKYEKQFNVLKRRSRVYRKNIVVRSTLKQSHESKFAPTISFAR